jgi:hypothetical protein
MWPAAAEDSKLSDEQILTGMKRDSITYPGQNNPKRYPGAKKREKEQKNNLRQDRGQS